MIATPLAIATTPPITTPIASEVKSSQSEVRVKSSARAHVCRWLSVVTNSKIVSYLTRKSATLGLGAKA